jgi:hypothetical protein
MVGDGTPTISPCAGMPGKLIGADSKMYSIVAVLPLGLRQL